MSEFINEFGKQNFIIMLAILGIVLLALIIILIIENRNSRRYEESRIEYYEEEKPVVNEYAKDEVVYVDHEPTKEEAKEKLEAVTKKLIEDDLKHDYVIEEQEVKKEEIEKEEDYGLIEHTEFETYQEEESVISYDELIKSSQNINDINDKLLEDEEKSAITIEELYRKHEEKQDLKPEIKIDNPVFEEEKKFKNSDVISPVFGIYSGEVKNSNEVLKEIDKKVGKEDLEDEIRKTEEFLEELKRLKSKLN